MSEITERVLSAVSAIPSGRVMTYGDVAEAAGTGARVVGRILHNDGHDVPWWRVVAADGRPFELAAPAARSMYIEESTPMLVRDGDVRVDLARASWSAPSGE
jgi:methylated-DNA-protein-cysteine methyltransferase-like protein